MFVVNVNKDEKNAGHYDYDFDQYKSFTITMKIKIMIAIFWRLKKRELAKKNLGGNFKLSTAFGVFIIFIIHLKYFFISNWLKCPG